MADFDWTTAVITAVITYCAIQYGRWTQRRDDRKAAERRQTRRLAQLLAEQTLRRPPRG